VRVKRRQEKRVFVKGRIREVEGSEEKAEMQHTEVGGWKKSVCKKETSVKVPLRSSRHTYTYTIRAKRCEDHVCVRKQHLSFQYPPLLSQFCKRWCASRAEESRDSGKPTGLDLFVPPSPPLRNRQNNRKATVSCSQLSSTRICYFLFFFIYQKNNSRREKWRKGTTTRCSIVQLS
jgi:hypothetical protein